MWEGDRRRKWLRQATQVVTLVLISAAGGISCDGEENKEKEVAARWAHIEEQGVTPKANDSVETEDAGDIQDAEEAPAAEEERAKETPEAVTPQAKPAAPGELDGLTADKVKAAIEASGWTILGEPDKVDQDGSQMTLYPIIKPPMGGVVGLCKYDNELVARGFAERMENQPGGGVVKIEGGNVLTVAIPKHKEKAQVLLEKIIARAKK